MQNRLVFFGTPYFAAVLLEYLAKEKISLIGVVTQPDRPRGRFQNLSFSPVKEVALEQFPGVPIFQPEKASDPVFIQTLDLLKPDLFVVVGYGQILKQKLLDVPRLGSINVHASLLPKYRGAAPIQRSLMAGEKKTGVTIMKMVAELDAGDMLGVSEVDISEEMNHRALENALLDASKPLLKEILIRFDKGEVLGAPQNHKEATYAKKLTPEEFQIAWDFDASAIHRLIQALSPKPGAWCWIHGEGEKKRLKILQTKVLPMQKEAPGEVFSHHGYPLVVSCLSHSLALLEVQLEGKKAMKVEEFLRGLKGKIFFH